MGRGKLLGERSITPGPSQVWGEYSPLVLLLFHLFVHNNHKSITFLIRTPAACQIRSCPRGEQLAGIFYRVFSPPMRSTPTALFWYKTRGGLRLRIRSSDVIQPQRSRVYISPLHRPLRRRCRVR